jgi:hypothetical protein
MKPKSAVVLIGKARMRPVRVQPLHQPIDEPKPVVVPFIQPSVEKSVPGKLYPSLLSRCDGSGRGIDSDSNLVQQPIEKITDLRVGRCPKTVSVINKSLVEMALGYHKVVLVEQADDLVFCFWQFQAGGEHAAQGPISDDKTIQLKAVMKSDEFGRKFFRF